MILFCEECGTKHIVDPPNTAEDPYRFTCTVCRETLVLSGGRVAHAALNPGTPGSVVKPLEVLVVDDSKIIRTVLRDIIESDGHKRVVGEAANGQEALELLSALHPDVITLDINMPVMDGLTTLKHIMINHPVPTVMISALTQEGSTETFESLKYGAIDFLPKPSRTKGADLQTQKREIIRKIELAAKVQLGAIRYLRRPPKDKTGDRDDDGSVCRYLVVMGVAEGGYGALLNVVPRIASHLPAAYVAVMHQAPHHIDGFARYLDRCSAVSVKRIGDDLQARTGTCYLACASEPIGIAREGDRIMLKCNGGNPAASTGIDQVLVAAAECMGDKLAGILMTGAGEDGVAGLGAVMRNGGKVFVQDPVSCLYKGTPLQALDRYDIENSVSDRHMAGVINDFLAVRTQPAHADQLVS